MLVSTLWLAKCAIRIHNCRLFFETVIPEIGKKMATLLTKSRFLSRSWCSFHRQRFGRIYTWFDSINDTGCKRGKRILKNYLLLAATGATCGALLYLLDRSVEAAGLIVHPPSYPWEFEGFLTSLDHSAVRRGWQVYRAVCYTCHSLRYMRFMDLMDVSHTADEVKAIAAEFEVSLNSSRVVMDS